MEVPMRVHCSLVLSLLFVLLYSSSARGEREQLKLPSAMVVGRVYCHSTCFHHEFSKPSHFVSGAALAVECGDPADKPRYRKVARTDGRGVFRVRLPASISEHADSIDASCSVKLLESNDPLCGVASPSKAAGVLLTSEKNGVGVYSAGTFSLKPTNRPAHLCGGRPPVSGERRRLLVELPAFILAPPSIPLVPSPPSVGPVPLPANPLFPPPSLLPPNPLQPPPPSLLPPNPLQPPSPPEFNLPPVPLLTPPPPPPPPVLPFPPVPAVPIPRIPGVPPAAEASP